MTSSLSTITPEDAIFMILSYHTKHLLYFISTMKPAEPMKAMIKSGLDQFIQVESA